jgi:hypothetical protein
MDMIISHNYSIFFEVISYLWIAVGTIFVSKTTYPNAGILERFHLIA